MTVSIIAVKSHDTKCAAISYDELSNNVMTVGVDGIVHVWSALTDNCVKTYSVTENVNSMVYEKDRIFVASSMNIIESYCTNNVKNVAVLDQFLSEVNHLRLSKDKSCLVACSSDNSAKVLQLSHSDDNESREILLNGHESPIMSVDIDADCTLVATASCDGYVIIWRARDGAQITKLPILDKVKDASQATNKCRLRFSPSSDPILSVPLSDSISLLDCDDWTVRGSLKWDKVCDKPITECIFTDDGCFLIAGTLDGYIIVWHIQSLTLVESWSSSRGSAITGMLWYPKKDKTLLFSDASGYWEAAKLDLNKKEKVKDSLSMDELNEMFDDFAEEDMDDIDLDKVSVASTVKQDSEDDSNMEDEFNLSLIKAEFEKKEDTQIVVAPGPFNVQPPVAKKTVHPPVRPGATPINAGMQLLLWNSVGALKKHYIDGSTESLEVYFHDCNQYRSIIVKPEIIDCDMGDVNTFAILLVSDQEMDDDEVDDDDEGSVKPAMVYVQSVSGSWPTWKTCLPTGESPMGCCLAGEDYAVVLTDKGFLRYFSLTICGMQSYVESVHGRPVAIAGSCYDPEKSSHPRIVVVVEDEGRLLWRLEEMRPGMLVQRGRVAGSIATEWHSLPLSEESRLAWIGFSDGGALYTVDSKQIVRRLLITKDHGRFSVPRWSPVLDLRQAIDKKSRGSDRHFPVGFTDRHDASGATVLRCHGSRFPSLVPWPHLSVVPFSVPLCPGQGDAANLEGSLTLLHTLPDWTSHDPAIAAADNQLLLKLFLNAMTQNHDVRALAIAALMPDSSVVQIAIRAAVRQRKKVLADQLGKLALSKDEEVRQSKQQVEEEDEEEEESEDKENEEESAEEEEEEEDGESEDEPSRESAPRRVASVVNVDKLVNGVSPVKESIDEDQTAERTPFRVRKTTARVTQGITAVDKLGLTSAKKMSPKKSAMVFGNFVPSPSAKTFKIKPKRKSTMLEGSPVGKKSKK